MWKYHSPRIQIGQLRERLTIKEASEEKDAAKQTIRTWDVIVHEDVPASKEIVSGGETLRGRQIEASVTAVFTIRALSSLTPQHQVYHQQDGTTYGIVKIEPADDRGQFMLIQCKRVTNNG